MIPADTRISQPLTSMLPWTGYFFNTGTFYISAEFEKRITYELPWAIVFLSQTSNFTTTEKTVQPNKLHLFYLNVSNSTFLILYHFQNNTSIK